jgi:hypothetical protein
MDDVYDSLDSPLDSPARGNYFLQAAGKIRGSYIREFHMLISTLIRKGYIAFYEELLTR